MVNTLEGQTEEAMGFPTGGDPSIIDPTTGKPYDSSGSVRQQQEITRQAEAAEEFTEEFNKAQLQKDIEAKVADAMEDYRGSYSNLDSSGNIEGALDSEGFFLNPREPLKRDSEGRPIESLRPKLRPTKDFGPSFNFKSPIDKTIELNYLLRDPNAVYKGLEIVSGLKENTEFGEKAIQGFYDSVGEGQGLSATENAWCAAFVHYILKELGADTLKGLGGQRARKYIDYGSPVDNIKDSQEGDIVIFDFNGDGKGDHVAFYAGTRITDQDNPNKISVVGGNQGNEVSLMSRSTKDVLGIRRITKDDVNVSLSKDLAKQNPIFKNFIPKIIPDIPSNSTEAENDLLMNNKGGLIDMNEQTQMAFALGGEAETVDPISGNDVPPGSLPVEVRDDIDAKLSEGEYVVPADVVRFFGVKFFEDLRMEAKQGLQQMDMDGRIGGEPIDDSTSPQMAEMSDKDIDDLIDAEMNNMSQGGMIGQQQPSKSMYSDPKKVDQVIAKISAAAKESPELSSMLSERGVTLPNTVATQTPEQMQDANRPDMSEKPKMGANKGGLMGYSHGGGVDGFDSSVVPKSDFSLEDFDSSNYFEKLMSSGGSKIQRIEVIGPGGKMFIFWNSKIPLPDGYKLVASKKDSKETKKKEGKSWIDKNPPPENNLNYDTLTIPEMQTIQRDIESKKLFVASMGPLGVFVARNAIKQGEEALMKRTALVNAIDNADPRKAVLLKQLANIKAGKDAVTGKDLNPLPGKFDIVKGDFGSIFGKKIKGYEEAKTYKTMIDNLYQKKRDPEEFDLFQGLDKTGEDTTETAPKNNVSENNVSENNVYDDINTINEFGGSENAADEIITDSQSPWRTEDNYDVASVGGTGFESLIRRQIDKEDAKRNEDRTPGKTIAQQQQEAGGGNRADQQAIDTGFGSGDTGGKDDDYGTGQGSDLGGYGFLNKGGLIGKPKKKKNKSYKKGGYVTSKKTKQRENGLASRP